MGTWATALVPAPLASRVPDLGRGFKNQTVRMVVRTSVGGDKGRVRLSNRYGTKPLTVGHATMARPMLEAGAGDLHADTLHEVSFAGQKTVTIPPGGTILSDVVDMAIPWTDDVAISIFLPGETGPPTLHNLSRTTSYVGEGDPRLRRYRREAAADLPDLVLPGRAGHAQPHRGRRDRGARDSISDGVGSTNNTNRRWTNFMAARLNQVAANRRAPGVLNEAVAGNRLGRDGTDFKSPEFGVNASARFAEGWDVPGRSACGDPATGYQRCVDQQGRAQRDHRPDAVAGGAGPSGRAEGLRVHAHAVERVRDRRCVVQYTPALDSIRLTVNNYLRTTSDFDGLLDFDKVLRDPSDPSKLRKDYDFSDHIHPNDAGLEAMAKAIPLEMLLRR